MERCGSYPLPDSDYKPATTPCLHSQPTGRLLLPVFTEEKSRFVLLLSLVEFKLPGAHFEHHMATPFVNFLINLHLMFLADIADSCLDTLFY